MSALNQQKTTNRLTSRVCVEGALFSGWFERETKRKNNWACAHPRATADRLRCRRLSEIAKMELCGGGRSSNQKRGLVLGPHLKAHREGCVLTLRHTWSEDQVLGLDGLPGFTLHYLAKQVCKLLVCHAHGVPNNSGGKRELQKRFK